MLSPETLQEPSWERRIVRFESARFNSLGGLLEKIAPVIGFAIAALLWLLGARWGKNWLQTMAYVAASVTTLSLLYALFAPNGKAHLQKITSKLILIVGMCVTHILLVPLYIVGFSVVGLLNRISGQDRLHLKQPSGARPTLWQTSDTTPRKDATTAKMFAAETPAKGNLLGGMAKLGLLALALFLVGECYFRSLGYHKPLLYMQDVYSGYRIQPNQKVNWEGGEVVINNFGMRNRENITEAKPPDVFRILLLGDSTLYGNDDLPQDTIYSARLEEMLDKTRPTQVLNAGVNGAGPDQNWGMLRRFPHAFQADVLMVCIPLADLYRAKTELGATRWNMNHPRLAWEYILTYYLPEWKQKLNARNTYSSVKPIYNYEDFLIYSTEKYVDLARTAKAAGAEVWFQIMPQLHNGTDANAGIIRDPKADPSDSLTAYYRPHFDHLSQSLLKDGVACYLPLDVFKGKGDHTNKQMWHDRAHLGPQGHAVYADYLYKQITTHSKKWAQPVGN